MAPVKLIEQTVLISTKSNDAVGVIRHGSVSLDYSRILGVLQGHRDASGTVLELTQHPPIRPILCLMIVLQANEVWGRT